MNCRKRALSLILMSTSLLSGLCGQTVAYADDRESFVTYPMMYLAEINLPGDCQVFDASQTYCQWEMPSSCKPVIDREQDYQHTAWMTCVRDAATVTMRPFRIGVAGEAPAPISAERREAMAIIESLQTSLRSWNMTEAHQRPDLIASLFARAQRVTSEDADEQGLHVRDEAVVYGMERVIIPLLSEVKVYLDTGVPSDG